METEPIFFAGDGKDTINGGDQDDTISGGDDNDTLRGNGGSDKLIGNGHNDQLFGGEMRDMLYGSDPLSFAAGFEEQTTDELFGEGGDDDLFGSGGGDKLVGGTGRDKLFGGPGDDTLFGGTEANLQETEADDLNGGPGNDTIFFHEADTLHFSGDGTSYTVDLTVLPFVGAHISGPDDNDTLNGGALNAELSFDNVNVTFEELGGVLANRVEIQKLSQDLKDELDRLLNRNKIIEDINRLLELKEEGVSEANWEFVNSTALELAFVFGGHFATAGSGFANANNLLKSSANTTAEYTTPGRSHARLLAAFSLSV